MSVADIIWTAFIYLVFIVVYLIIGYFVKKHNFADGLDNPIWIPFMVVFWPLALFIILAIWAIEWVVDWFDDIHDYYVKRREGR